MPGPRDCATNDTLSPPSGSDPGDPDASSRPARLCNERHTFVTARVRPRWFGRVLAELVLDVLVLLVDLPLQPVDADEAVVVRRHGVVLRLRGVRLMGQQETGPLVQTPRGGCLSRSPPL